jgi:hypothetical protein
MSIKTSGRKKSPAYANITPGSAIVCRKNLKKNSTLWKNVWVSQKRPQASVGTDESCKKAPRFNSPELFYDNLVKSQNSDSTIGVSLRTK